MFELTFPSPSGRRTIEELFVLLLGRQLPRLVGGPADPHQLKIRSRPHREPGGHGQVHGAKVMVAMRSRASTKMRR